MPLFRKPAPDGKPPRKAASPSRKSSKSKKKRFRPLRWLRILTLLFLISTTAAVLLFRFVPPPLTPLMALRSMHDAVHGRLPRLHKDWQSLEHISPRLIEAVTASEDQLFFDHHGFDWEAIRSALTLNGTRRRKLGASTISQQTAKNLFLWPDRTWARKALEAYFTLEMELMWSKRRILEVYLNIIETGDGVYGAEAAAQTYFHEPASALDADQAALIAACLPNPRAWSPAHPTAFLRRRQSWILRQMVQRGPLPDGLSEGGPPVAKLRPRPAPAQGNMPVTGADAGGVAPAGANDSALHVSPEPSVDSLPRAPGPGASPSGPPSETQGARPREATPEEPPARRAPEYGTAPADSADDSAPYPDAQEH